jgi:transposase
VAAEEAARAALAKAGATRWVSFTLSESIVKAFRPVSRGRANTESLYKSRDKTVFTITAEVLADQVTYDAICDGMFPLITNDPQMTPAEVLATYHYQPNLERRNHMLKGPQVVAPVFLENPHRIEAILVCHFLAMLTEALIEREIRTSMKAEELSGMPVYPEFRNCPAPSAPRILELFSGVQRHRLVNKGATEQVFEPQLSALQIKILNLLHVPITAYNP